ncbi:uncharacterized protein V6R79_001975 [Siganus canaliculatus]
MHGSSQQNIFWSALRTKGGELQVTFGSEKKDVRVYPEFDLSTQFSQRVALCLPSSSFFALYPKHAAGDRARSVTLSGTCVCSFVKGRLQVPLLKGGKVTHIGSFLPRTQNITVCDGEPAGNQQNKVCLGSGEPSCTSPQHKSISSWFQLIYKPQRQKSQTCTNSDKHNTTQRFDLDSFNTNEDDTVRSKHTVLPGSLLPLTPRWTIQVPPMGALLSHNLRENMMERKEQAAHEGRECFHNFELELRERFWHERLRE